MNSLKTNIKNQLYKAVSGNTEHVYFYELPNEDLLKTLTLTYELNNTGNDSTYDSRNSTRNFELQVNINNPTTPLIDHLSIYIMNEVFNLKTVDDRVRNVQLLNQFQDRNPDLKIYTEVQRYNIVYS
jgi:hypothetical protein